MGFFDKIKNALKSPDGGGSGETGIQKGGIFAVEYLRVKVDGMRVRKTWKRIATLEVNDETKDLGKENGFEYLDRGELHRIVENYSDPMMGGVFLRLRYFPNPTSMAGARIIWTIYVEETDDGDLSIDPNPDIPNNAELREIYGVDMAGMPQQVPQQSQMNPMNPMDLQSALMPVQQFAQTMMMFAEIQNQIRQAFRKLAGVEEEGNSREKSKIEMLKEIVEELNQYEQLRKQLGGHDDKLVEKMPWWALLLTQFAQNFGPLLGMGLMGGGMGGYGQPYYQQQQQYYPPNPSQGQAGPLPPTPTPPKPKSREETPVEQPLPEPPRPPRPRKDTSKAPRPKPVPVEPENPKAEVKELNPKVGEELLKAVEKKEKEEETPAKGKADEEEIEKQIEELLSEVKKAEEVVKA